VEEVELEGCPGCGGLWLDGGELKQLAESAASLKAAGDRFSRGASAPTSAQRGPCPACAGALTPFEFDRFRGVRLDRCKACGGVWLDAGEAQAMAARLGSAPVDPAPEPAPAAAPDPDGLELAYDPRARRAEAAPDDAPLQAPPRPRFESEHAGFAQVSPEVAAQFDPHRRRLPLGRLGLGAVALLGLAWWLWPVYLPAQPLAPAAGNTTAIDPCDGKARCVLVVTAPWCPACQQSHGMMLSLIAHFKGSADVGVKPVVALDTQAKLEAYAKTFGDAPVYLDPKGQLLHALGASSIPHWFVVNAKGRVVKSASGAYVQLEPELHALGLDKN